MNTITDSELPAILRRLRTNAGLSQEEVAKRVGKSAQMGGKWERGENVPSAETRLALAGLFKVEPEDLGYYVPGDTYRVDAPPAYMVQFMEQHTTALKAIMEKLEAIEANTAPTA